MYRFNEANGDAVVDATGNAFDGVFEARDVPGNVNASTSKPLRIVDGFNLGTPGVGNPFVLSDERAADSGHSDEFSLRFAPTGAATPAVAETVVHLDLSTVANAVLSFNYFLDNGGRDAIDQARVELVRSSTAPGAGEVVAVLASTVAGDAPVELLNGSGDWQLAAVNLHDYLGQSDLEIRLVYEQNGFARGGECVRRFLCRRCIRNRRTQYDAGRGARYQVSGDCSSTTTWCCCPTRSSRAAAI